MAHRWRRQPPDRDGWWQFDEDGTGKQFILIACGCVASDDEWEREVGRPPKDVFSENYWEGNDVIAMTFGPLTTGKWFYWGFVPDCLKQRKERTTMADKMKEFNAPARRDNENVAAEQTNLGKEMRGNR